MCMVPLYSVLFTNIVHSLSWEADVARRRGPCKFQTMDAFGMYDGVGIAYTESMAVLRFGAESLKPEA